MLAVLEPYLMDVVLIGGWVPELYRRYGGFDRWLGMGNLTREADMLLPSNIFAAKDREPIATLLQRAGLDPIGDSGSGAAVWRQAKGGGEEIEFMVPHNLAAENPVTVIGQPGLAAISLPRVEILERHSRVLRIPADRAFSAIDVRIPLIGAFVLNKAMTFADRPPDPGSTSSPKRGKDLVYLYDLMSAGPEVAERVRVELREMKHSNPNIALELRLALTRLKSLLRSPGEGDWVTATASLAEANPGMQAATARSELEGRLTDLTQLIGAVQKEKRTKD